MGNAAYSVPGGNQQLPEAMARSLKSPVLLGKEIVAIDATDGSSSVTCSDGSRYPAAHIVCSLPFSTLRQIRIDPPLRGPQARAVRTLPYQTITLIYFAVNRPFWEKDGMSPSMWTNGPAGIILAQYFGGADDEVTGLVAQGRGQLGAYWDRLGKDAAMRLVHAELEAIRPAAKGALRPLVMHSWALERFNAGDWAVFAPGQVSLAQSMAAAHGRLHFCGEHTAMGNRGMEGAMESGERAAIEVLS
jgi:monoamine oxidase